MTKEAALRKFFKSFGIDAYTATSVPEDVQFPYLTYTTPISHLYGQPASITVNVYYYSTGESQSNAKAREIAERIGIGGQMLECDGGYIWLQIGSPESETIPNEIDQNIKGRYMNITAVYLTPT